MILCVIIIAITFDLLVLLNTAISKGFMIGGHYA